MPIDEAAALSTAPEERGGQTIVSSVKADPGKHLRAIGEGKLVIRPTWPTEQAMRPMADVSLANQSAEVLPELASL